MAFFGKRSRFGTISVTTNERTVRRNLAAREKIMAQNMAEVYRQTATYVVTDLYSQNPWDTGRSRSNWRASVNTPSGAYDVNADLGGSAVALRARSDMRNASADTKVFYVTNNAPYIAQLDDPATSPQAPRHWVRTSVKKVALRMNGTRLLKRNGVQITG